MAQGDNRNSNKGKKDRKTNKGWSNKEQTIDKIAKSMPEPVIADGTYAHSAGQEAILHHLQQKLASLQNMAQSDTPISNLELTIVGNKIRSGTWLTVLVVVLFALLFSGYHLSAVVWFFFCAFVSSYGRFKKYFHPIYKVDTSIYNAVAKIIEAVPTINSLTLSVADNAFNAQRAQILYNMARGRELGMFEFLNMAEDLDWKEDEYSNFKVNMKPIVSLGVSCTIKWDHKHLHQE